MAGHLPILRLPHRWDLPTLMVPARGDNRLLLACLEAWLDGLGLKLLAGDVRLVLLCESFVDGSVALAAHAEETFDVRGEVTSARLLLL